MTLRDDEALRRLRTHLPRAGLLMLPEAYLRRARAIGIACLVGAVVVCAAVLVFAAMGRITWSRVALAGFVVAVLALAYLSYRAVLDWPRARAALRGSRLDGKLPYAVNYLSTMSSGGLGLDRMFAQLATQGVYGPVAEEARIIHRDLAFLGLDVVGALRAAIDRSPSLKFQDFLQGLLTTVTSGGDLRLFLETKSDQFFAENRTVQDRFLEQLALLAEVFVVVVVAAPLVIIVLLSVLTLFGRSGPEVLLLGYATVLLILPFCHAAFAATVRLLQPGR